MLITTNENGDNKLYDDDNLYDNDDDDYDYDDDDSKTFQKYVMGFGERLKFLDNAENKLTNLGIVSVEIDPRYFVVLSK